MVKLTSDTYPQFWKKDDVSIKIYCSIPNIATGILFSAGNALFLVDPGDGALRDLNKDLTSQQMLSISDIFVTHGHHDHVGGIWSLLTYFKVMRRTQPINIFYPAGCIEIESIYHAFSKVYSRSMPYTINLRKISDASRITSKRVTINPFPVVHKEKVENKKTLHQVPALGFKFAFNGIKVTYGGDTALCESLARHTKGADLAILEAGHDDETPDEMHMSMSEAISLGETANEFFLVHVPE